MKESNKTPEKISLKIFLDNAVKGWQFSLDVAWDQNRRHPELSRGQCLKERSFLRQVLGGDQAPVFGKACQLADTVENKKEMQCLLPEILDTVRGKYPPPTDSPEYEPGRSFRYELTKQNYCYLHIRNAKRPDSFLKYPDHVAENLRWIMDLAERESSCDTLYTATWMNSLPTFLLYFPEEWKRNLTDTADFGPTLGWQGQFINREGLLNQAVAARFLQTGVLPYARRESHCTFAAIREHLKNLEL